MRNRFNHSPYSTRHRRRSRFAETRYRRFTEGMDWDRRDKDAYRWIKRNYGSNKHDMAVATYAFEFLKDGDDSWPADELLSVFIDQLRRKRILAGELEREIYHQVDIYLSTVYFVP